MLSEVTGDSVSSLPRVPSPVEITEIYLWCWDMKLSIRGWGGGGVGWLALKKQITVFTLTGLKPAKAAS